MAYSSNSSQCNLLGDRKGGFRFPKLESRRRISSNMSALRCITSRSVARIQSITDAVTASPRLNTLLIALPLPVAFCTPFDSVIKHASSVLSMFNPINASPHPEDTPKDVNEPAPPCSPNFQGATVKSSATTVIAAAGTASFASSDLFSSLDWITDGNSSARVTTALKIADHSKLITGILSTSESESESYM